MGFLPSRPPPEQGCTTPLVIPLSSALERPVADCPSGGIVRLDRWRETSRLRDQPPATHPHMPRRSTRVVRQLSEAAVRILRVRRHGPRSGYPPHRRSGWVPRHSPLPWVSSQRQPPVLVCPSQAGCPKIPRGWVSKHPPPPSRLGVPVPAPVPIPIPCRCPNPLSSAYGGRADNPPTTHPRLAVPLSLGVQTSTKNGCPNIHQFACPEHPLGVQNIHPDVRPCGGGVLYSNVGGFPDLRWIYK